jgi:uncharacterized UBP type Zn finger protein
MSNLDADKVEILKGMGLSENAAKRALLFNGQNLEDAAAWCELFTDSLLSSRFFDHSTDPDIDQPVGPLVNEQQQILAPNLTFNFKYESSSFPVYSVLMQ